MYKHIILTGVLALSLASCAKETSSVKEESGPLMDFQTTASEGESSELLDRQTKSGVLEDNSSLKTAGNQIALFGSYVKGGVTNQVFDSDPELLTYGSGWHYAPLQRWQKTADYLFRACFPYTSDIQSSSSAKLMVVNYKSVSEQYDLLVATETRNPATDIEGTNPVTLNFKHALSAVRFTIQYRSDVTPTTTKDCITELYVTKIYPIGALAYGQTNSSDPIDAMNWVCNYFSETEQYYRWNGSKEFGVGSKQTVYDGSGVTFTIPQTLKGAQVNFNTEKGGATLYTASLMDKISKWEPGKIYTYNLIVLGSSVEVDVDIKDWTDITSNIDIYL